MNVGLSMPADARLDSDEGIEFAAAAGVLGTERRSAPPRWKDVISRGPLVAVCALAPEAGASTLAYLLATYVASRGSADRDAGPVLLLDAGEASGGLARCVGTESPRSLGELVTALHAGQLMSHELFAVIGSDLRLIATGRRTAAPVDEDALTRILRDSREAHGLTIADCGTLSSASQRLTYELASHVLWVLPASDGCLTVGRAALAAVRPTGAHEVLVVRSGARSRSVPIRGLALLADRRGAPLVLMPQTGTLDGRRRDRALAACEVTLEALTLFLLR